MNLLVPVDELADALLDADTRPKPQHAPRAREIGIRQPHVPWLIGVALDPRLLAQRRGNERDQAIQPPASPPPRFTVSTVPAAAVAVQSRPAMTPSRQSVI